MGRPDIKVKLILNSSLFKPSFWTWKLITTALQRTNTENSNQIFPEEELRSHSRNFHIHVSVSDLYIPTIPHDIVRDIEIRETFLEQSD